MGGHGHIKVWPNKAAQKAEGQVGYVAPLKKVQGSHFPRATPVPRAQLFAARVKIGWCVRISGQFGRTRPVHRLTGACRFDRNCP